MVSPVNLGSLFGEAVKEIAAYQGVDPSLAEGLGKIGNVAGQAMQQSLSVIPKEAQAPVAAGIGVGGILATALAAGPGGVVIVGAGAVAGLVFSAATGRLDK